MYIYKWDKYNSQVFIDAKKLRELIFIDEQGFKEEFDEEDKTCEHMVMYDSENNPIATARVILNYDGNNNAKVGRICVLKDMRKKGLGALLIKEAEEFSKNKSMIEMHLGAQIQALSFYEKIGYKKYGEKYFEETVPHINMKKYL